MDSETEKKLAEQQNQMDRLGDKVDASMEIMESGHKEARAENESAIHRLQLSNEKSVGDLRLTTEKAIGEFRMAIGEFRTAIGEFRTAIGELHTTIERNSRTLLFQTIAAVAATAGITVLLIKVFGS